LLNGASASLPVPPAAELTAADRWILSRLHAVVAEVDAYYEAYEFAKVCETVQAFAWSEFCDWYVELAKTSLSSGGAAADAARAVLGHVLDRLFRLLHPVMPFVTERLWLALTGGESIVVSSWPSPESSYLDAAAEAELAAVQRLVTEVRRFRADQGLKPGQRVPARLVGIESTALVAHEPAIRSLLRLEAPADGFGPTASLLVENVTVELDTAGTIDVAAERKRLEKDLAAARKEKAQSEGKLGNAQFLEKAPPPVVEKVRAQLETADAEIARLESQLAGLPGAS
jgi:valyl-tRNA synthetase